METEGRYTLVGTLVLGVVALMTLAIIWLAGAADHIAYQTYSIYFKQQSLDGLAVGSAVKMRGIKVGVVDSYRFVQQDGEEAVSVTARVDEGVPVHQGAAAYIKRNLVTGIAAVEINNGPVSGVLLDDAPRGERYPVIAEGSSDIDKVATAVSRLAENGAAVLEKMNVLLSDDNQRAISQTLANLNELSGHLAANKASLDAAVQGIRDASDEFRFAGASISQAATRAEGSIVGVGDNANLALKEAVAAIGKLQKDATEITARIQQLSETGTLEITNVSRDVRTSADVLTNAGQRLSNPRAILFGPTEQQLGPGESLP
ncbi:MAG: ABC transporter substrate-binding protein [Hydrogenophilales bacterium 16-64-46]|nr:MAG: ABC transporter substrate-binding protein [Hydrogenophilales bacterium 12-64-13]OYZ05854.1 MAG: ABC transporter substrate-binding protein [Hydrogenophilales bacterium 16-64-46]OZA39790.1 MAG: ABC transporter substrate-binding protein [Hydrogenophilales bacterium 17-64-34]HQS98667.1 MlaD family protein [Thiobacillus sp.]